MAVVPQDRRVQSHPLRRASVGGMPVEATGEVAPRVQGLARAPGCRCGRIFAGPARRRTRCDMAADGVGQRQHDRVRRMTAAAKQLRPPPERGLGLGPLLARTSRAIKIPGRDSPTRAFHLALVTARQRFVFWRQRRTASVPATRHGAGGAERVRGAVRRARSSVRCLRYSRCCPVPGRRRV
jgi:hypothetical protein